MTTFSAAIMAGGGSVRMGKDKAFLEWKGESILQHILKTVRSVTDDIFIVSDLPSYQNLEVPCINDIYPDHGPLGGIYAALQHSSAQKVLVLGCDMPLLSEEFLKFLIQNAGDCDAAVSQHKDRLHPLAAVYDQSCSASFKSLLEEKKLRMMNAIKDVNMKTVQVNEACSFYHPDLFFNVNTPEAYAALLDKSL